MIKLKRAYEAPSNDDGVRVLVERLWPRGLSKERAQIDQWCRALAPSNDLRKWYGHEVDKWPEFKKRYSRELKENKEALAELVHLTASTVTFIYAAKDEIHNSAVVLKEFIEKANKRARPLTGV